MWWQISLSFSLQHFHCKILSMRWILYSDFCQTVTCLELLYLARNSKTQHETYKQTCKWQVRKIYSLHYFKIRHHMITLFESLTETNGVSSGLKKSHTFRLTEVCTTVCYALLHKTYLYWQKRVWISYKNCTYTIPGPCCKNWNYEILHLFNKFRYQ